MNATKKLAWAAALAMGLLTAGSASADCINEELATAPKFAGNDGVVMARLYNYTTFLEPGGTFTLYGVLFSAGRAEIFVANDAVLDGDIDVEVFDTATGIRVGIDTRPLKSAQVIWRPAETRMYHVRVRNAGTTPQRFTIWANW